MKYFRNVAAIFPCYTINAGPIESERKKARKRVAGVILRWLNFVPQSIILRKSYIGSPQETFYPLKPVIWRSRQLTGCIAQCVATRRVTARANGVVCRVRGSQPNGKRALLAERGEDTYPGDPVGDGCSDTRKWGRKTRTCARRSVIRTRGDSGGEIVKYSFLHGVTSTKRTSFSRDEYFFPLR